MQRLMNATRTDWPWTGSEDNEAACLSHSHEGPPTTAAAPAAPTAPHVVDHGPLGLPVRQLSPLLLADLALPREDPRHLLVRLVLVRYLLEVGKQVGPELILLLPVDR